jgi:RNA methyltransferase, TrmH family
MITSPENAKLKLVRKLGSRRWRDKLGLFVAEGEDLVDAARAAGWEPVEVLVAGENVAPELLAQVSTLAHPPRVIGVFRTSEGTTGAAVADAAPADGLALWRVADPGNVGTLARAVDAFGGTLRLSDGCADPFGPKALRASMGSIFRVPLLEFELPPGSVALLAHGATPLHGLDLEVGSNFVLGSEREGLPPEIVERCDAVATIPLPGRAESLNVAMAGTVALYEASRRRAIQTVSSPPVKARRSNHP